MAAINFLEKIERNIRLIRMKLTLRRVWSEAETFMRKHGYTITYEEFNQIFGGWYEMELEMIPTLKGKVAFTIHEAVELEEVKKLAGKLVEPRDYYDEVLRKTGKYVVEPHLKAVEMEEKYLESLKWR